MNFSTLDCNSIFLNRSLDPVEISENSSGGTYPFFSRQINSSRIVESVTKKGFANYDEEGDENDVVFKVRDSYSKPEYIITDLFSTISMKSNTADLLKNFQKVVGISSIKMSNNGIISIANYNIELASINGISLSVLQKINNSRHRLTNVLGR